MSKTATTVVTADQIIAEVRRLAAERPDFVYLKPEGAEFCLYKHPDGSPGCIFGQALNNLGVLVDELTTGTIGNVLMEHGIDREAPQGAWMRDVQYMQDIGTAWSEAVRQADEEYPGV